MAERARLTEAQRRVLEALRPLAGWASAHVGRIEEVTGLPPAATALALYGLEIGGLVERGSPVERWWRATPAGLAALSEEPADG